MEWRETLNCWNGGFSWTPTIDYRRYRIGSVWLSEQVDCHMMDGTSLNKKQDQQSLDIHSLIVYIIMHIHLPLTPCNPTKVIQNRSL